MADCVERDCYTRYIFNNIYATVYSNFILCADKKIYIYIYIWVESLIWFPIALIALATHLGANYYIEDLFIDTSVYDDYYQNISVNYEN